MQKIYIKGKDAAGATCHFSKWSSPALAEMAFYAYTHDARNQDLDWYLIVDGIEINWHCPLKEVAHA